MPQDWRLLQVHLALGAKVRSTRWSWGNGSKCLPYIGRHLQNPFKTRVKIGLCHPVLAIPEAGDIDRGILGARGPDSLACLERVSDQGKKLCHKRDGWFWWNNAWDWPLATTPTHTSVMYTNRHSQACVCIILCLSVFLSVTHGMHGLYMQPCQA